MSIHTQPQTDQFRFIPIGQLILSPLNVRKTGAEQGIDELAALILSQNVVQNLTVYEADVSGEGEPGTYAVVAGGRRWRALRRLLEQAQITRDYPVPCLVTPYERAVELSLAENSGRVEMHPADQFDAFRALVDAGQSIEDVAARFGVAPLVVQRRLKLANVAPPFIALYREGKVGLEVLMVLAVTDDHDKQQQAWESLKPYERYPDALRRILMKQEISTGDPLARFVGMKAYQKAGGVIRRDLFADEDQGATLDSALVHQLAAQKLDKQAAKLKGEGLPWAEVHLHLDYSARAAYGRVAFREREATPEEQQQLDALVAREAQLDAEAATAEDDEDRQSELYSQAQEIEAQIEALRERLTVPDPEQQALAGALICVGPDGKVSIERDVLRPKDAQRFGASRRKVTRATTADGSREHSSALVRRLTAHRTLALQAELVQQPMMAVVALTHRLVLDTLYTDEGAGNSAVQIHRQGGALREHAEDLNGSQAQLTLDAHRKSLQEHLPEDADTLPPWLVEQSGGDLLSLLAYCAAVTVDGVQTCEGPGVLDGLARAAKLDMRRWWTATVKNYLGAVPRARILAAVTEAVSAEAAVPLAKLKKTALAEAAERQLAGSGWLPPVLREPQA
jgi:ParB family chromosome partitioning protein